MTRTLAVLPLLIVSVFSALPACSGGAERCRTCGPTGSGGGTPGTGGMLAGLGGASGLGGTVGGAGGTVGGAGGTVGGAGGTVGGAGGTVGGAGGTVGGAGGTVGGAGGTVGGAGGTVGGAGGTVGGAGGTVGGAGGGTGGAMVDAGPPAPALIVFYPFDDANTTRITDASGNGRHGTATLATYGTGMVRGDLNMTNTTTPGTQYVTMPAAMLQTVRDVSFAAWVRVRTNRNWSRVFDFGVDQNINMFLTARANATNNPVRFAITIGGGAATAEQRLEAPALALNTWTHLTVVLGATSAIYVNGVVSMTSTTITLRPSDLGATVNNWIGRSTYAVDPWLDGEVDEFRIYGQALTAAEVMAVYLQR